MARPFTVTDPLSVADPVGIGVDAARSDEARNGRMPTTTKTDFPKTRDATLIITSPQEPARLRVSQTMASRCAATRSSKAERSVPRSGDALVPRTYSNTIGEDMHLVTRLISRQKRNALVDRSIDDG